MTNLPTGASPPTGRNGHQHPITQSESGKYLSRTEAVGPIQSSKIDALQRDLAATPRKGQRPNQQLLPLLIHPPMTAPLKPQNARKYCEFHEQSGHTTTKCQELKKTLHELINQILKRGPRFIRREQEPTQCQPQDEECSTEVVATIAGGYTEGMTRSAWKAQLKSAQ
ncbi:hypothetical protein Cgig2_016466 [Carnegiea gigantea]|uniref:Reverse transcriptase domain-containing protein n=1 Tax=Carnegiea gigantea TaxID=171969 RepID=A0A9Q1QM69_9CARY|nr:hypothetical protein Cgig2_016466 [Carnegiea gigantea]